MAPQTSRKPCIQHVVGGISLHPLADSTHVEPSLAMASLILRSTHMNLRSATGRRTFLEWHEELINFILATRKACDDIYTLV